MSNLQHLFENTNDLVFTAEFPSIDGGGMEKVAKDYRSQSRAARRMAEEHFAAPKVCADLLKRI